MYILTKEYNMYDQMGEYFCACFLEYPTVEVLTNFFGGNKGLASHVFEGGGRQKEEDEWYNLFEALESVPYC